MIVLVGHIQRGVGRVGSDVGEKRLLSFYRFDPSLGLAKKDVGAVAVCPLESAVMENRGIELLVIGYIPAAAGKRLANSAAAVDEHFVEATFVGPAIGFVA